MLTGVKDLVSDAGGTADLVELLQGTHQLCRAAGGARMCVQLMQANQDLIAAAGGAQQVRLHAAPSFRLMLRLCEAWCPSDIVRSWLLG